MKYWQKTYIWTLLLFLVALNMGAFLMYHAALNTSFSAERERGFAEHGFISGALEKDIGAVVSRNDNSKTALSSLFRNYSDYYMRQGVFIMLTGSDNSQTGYIPMPENALPAPENGLQAVVIRDAAAMPYLYTSGMINDTGYTLVTAHSVAAMRQSANDLARTLLIGSAGLSAVLSAALYLILKKLTHPIRTLSKATAALAVGEYTARAKINGQDELADLARSFNAMADKIQAQIDELTEETEKRQRFIDDLAHELRTPLTAIGGYAQYLAAADITEDERVSALQYISRESDRLADMSGKLLALAQLRHEDIKPSRVSLPPLFEDVQAATVQLAKEKKVSLIFEIADSAWQSDGTLLRMLFLNMVVNSIHACAEGGTVRVSADEHSASVSDDGCGMDAEALAHAVEPFYRADKARSRTVGGAGLGLSICERICMNLGLKMHIRSVPKEGTTVSILQVDNNAGTQP